MRMGQTGVEAQTSNKPISRCHTLTHNQGNANEHRRIPFHTPPDRCSEKAHSPSGKLTASRGVNWFSHFGCGFYFLHFSNRGLTHIQSAQSTQSLVSSLMLFSYIYTQVTTTHTKAWTPSRTPQGSIMPPFHAIPCLLEITNPLVTFLTDSFCLLQDFI